MDSRESCFAILQSRLTANALAAQKIVFSVENNNIGIPVAPIVPGRKSVFV